MTLMKKAEHITVTDYDIGMTILRSPDFGVDHPFRATRQVFGPTVVDTEAAAHIERKRSWTAQFLPANITGPHVQGIIRQSVAEGFEYAETHNDLLSAAVYIPNRVLLLLLGLSDVNPIEHHLKLRGITEFLETNQRSPTVLEARNYLHSGPFRAARALFKNLDDERQANEILLFSYAAGETTYVALKCLILLWAKDADLFRSRLESEGVQAFLSNNMRVDPPLGIATRYCKSDSTINGINFAKGDLVHIDIVSANQQCQRSGNTTMDFTFGSGRHSCPGHLLAKAELEAVADKLLQLDRGHYELEGDGTTTRPQNFRDPGKFAIRPLVAVA